MIIPSVFKKIYIKSFKHKVQKKAVQAEVLDDRAGSYWRSYQNYNRKVKCKRMVRSIVGPLKSHLWFMAIIKSMQGTTAANCFLRHKA